jgi:TolB protein
MNRKRYPYQDVPVRNDSRTAPLLLTLLSLPFLILGACREAPPGPETQSEVPAFNLAGPPEPGVGNGGDPVELAVMSIDGTNVKALTKALGISDLAWSPDGARIAFSRYVGIGGPPGKVNLEIYAANADGSGQVRLTRSAEPNDSNPAWSPDGTRIAFTRGDLAGEGSDVYVMDADGTNVQRLTDHPATDARPAWSSDGTRILFASRRESEVEELFVMNSDGSDVTPLDETGIPVVFAADRGKPCLVRGECGNYDIYAANLDGEGVRSLTNDRSQDSEPVLSPDGSRIVFSSDFDIYIMTAAGTDRTNLTKSEAIDSEPTWAADGRIIFSSDGDILVMNADGTGQTHLTQTEVFEHAPTLSPNGTKIAFTRSVD